MVMVMRKALDIEVDSQRKKKRLKKTSIKQSSLFPTNMEQKHGRKGG